MCSTQWLPKTFAYLGVAGTRIVQQKSGVLRTGVDVLDVCCGGFEGQAALRWVVASPQTLIACHGGPSPQGWSTGGYNPLQVSDFIFNFFFVTRVLTDDQTQQSGEHAFTGDQGVRRLCWRLKLKPLDDLFVTQRLSTVANGLQDSALKDGPQILAAGRLAFLLHSFRRFCQDLPCPFKVENVIGGRVAVLPLLLILWVQRQGMVCSAFLAVIRSNWLAT